MHTAQRGLCWARVWQHGASGAFAGFAQWAQRVSLFLPPLLPLTKKILQMPSGRYFGLKISSWVRVDMDVCMDLTFTF